MIDFNDAIKVAKENATMLLENADKFALEGVLLSNDGNIYEVTLSYELRGEDPLKLQGEDKGYGDLYKLATLMSRRRELKVFLVDTTGRFRGFKNARDR
ncbi:hypothetical protein JQK19_14755 [Chromobacterium violaceum]|uniref:hypothetical protein n=1 Tax=Chromobacterium violaceum TaxID=536 RepID=UPI001BE74EA5|nr:hypothetical protein [Chromobacterium violaceum]MBT2868501.1 hypothetical protein [Chromobacterium violaceum]